MKKKKKKKKSKYPKHIPLDTKALSRILINATEISKQLRLTNDVALAESLAKEIDTIHQAITEYNILLEHPRNDERYQVALACHSMALKLLVFALECSLHLQINFFEKEKEN